MVNTKTLLSSLFVLGLAVVQAEQIMKSEPVVTMADGLKGFFRGNCSCGGFPTSTPAAESEPLLSQSPGLVVNCDEEGSSTCKSLCVALATATKAKGPEILCNRLKNAEELKLSAFYKVCDKPWAYADMTAEEPLCCLDCKVKICASADQVMPTSGTNASPN